MLAEFGPDGLGRWPLAPGREGYERAALAVLDSLQALAEEGVLERLEGTPIRFVRTKRSNGSEPT